MIETGPCGDASVSLQYLNSILAALNVALATWLAKRRFDADVRENGRYECPLDQQQIDRGRRSQDSARGKDSD